MSDRDALIHRLLDYQKLVKAQEKKIQSLAYALYTEQSDQEVRKIAVDFARENEEIYLKLKRLIYDTRSLRGVQQGNRHEMIGTTDSFDSSLTCESPGVWKFHLPPFFSVQSSERGPSNAGKHVFYLVMNLLSGYELENNRIGKIEKPLIIFEHHICTDTQKPFDFDNIDSKRALDAMQGYFIDDDNALSLTVVNLAVKDEKESFCDIYIGDAADKGIYERLVRSRQGAD